MTLFIQLHCVAMFVFVGWMLRTFLKEWSKTYKNK